jgi:NADH:ubiquinone oxidoreductase subunit 2 (subunit N)
MTIFLMSLVGIPPLAGFAGKFLLFGAAMDAHFTWLALLAILNSVLSLAVYLRIIVPMYRLRGEGDKAVMQQDRQMLLIRTVWVVAVIATVGLGLAAQLLLGAIG